jgi:two-component system, chemotaxis family, sensor kinase CheA
LITKETEVYVIRQKPLDHFEYLPETAYSMKVTQQLFVTEVLDLLNELDEGLLQLRINPLSNAPLEQVFRIMHTIKGSAGMFGLQNIGSMAHELETIYYYVGQKKMQINEELIDLTLQAFDMVRDLLIESDPIKMADPSALLDYQHRAHRYLAAADLLENL